MLRAPTTPQEVEEMVELGRAMHAESAFAFLPYEDDVVLKTLRSLAAQGRLFLLRYEDDATNKLVGFFCGCTDKYFFNGERIPHDLAFYVHPSHRGKGMAVLRMIRWFEKWARLKRAREVCLGVSTGIKVAETGALLVRAGYTVMGGTFKRRIG